VVEFMNTVAFERIHELDHLGASVFCIALYRLEDARRRGDQHARDQHVNTGQEQGTSNHTQYDQRHRRYRQGYAGLEQ
jgi:hypothetical protein